jgi:UrcA family protein
MNTRHCIVLSIFVAAQLLASAASADPKRSDQVCSAVVGFGELDLSKPAGADALYKRIRTAAATVCNVNQSRESERIARSRACFKNAVDNAVAQVNHPRLSSLHERALGNQSDVLISATR